MIFPLFDLKSNRTARVKMPYVKPLMLRDVRPRTERKDINKKKRKRRENGGKSII